MTSTKENENEAAIRVLLEQWAEAVRRHDYDGILANHDGDIMMFDVPPPMRVLGLAEYRSTWDLFFRGHSPSDAFDILDLTVVADENVGFAIAMMRCGGKHNGNESYLLDFRLTVGLRKIAGRWRVVHEHHSVPAT